MRRRSLIAFALACSFFATGRADAQAVAATPDTQFDFANGLFARGHYASAADAYAAFLDLAPDDARAEVAMFRLGESRYALKQYPEAQQAYTTVLHRWPGGPKANAARLRLGQTALARGQYADAIVKLEMLLAEKIDDGVRAGALYALGQAAYEHGDTAKAIDAFSKLRAAPRTSDFQPFADYYLGYLRWRANEPGAAYEHFIAFARATQDPALRTEAWVRAGDTALAAEQYAAAADAFNTALAQEPAPDLRDASIRGLLWAEYSRARYEEALREAAQWRDKVTSPSVRAEADYVAGEAAFQAKDYARAQQLLESVVADPAAPDIREAARLRLAWTYFLKGDYAACATAADAGTASGGAGGREELAYLAAAARYGAQQYATAVDGLSAFVKAFPESPLRLDALYQLGVSHQALGQLASAKSAFESALAAGDAPRNGPRSLFKAGEVSYAMAQFDAALEYWQRIVSQHPADALAGDAQFRIGLTHYKLEQYPKMEAAFAAYRSAYPTGPLATEAAYWHGWALQQREDYAAAATAFSAVTEDRNAKHYADALGRQALCAYLAEQEAQAAILYVRYLREIPDRPLPRDVLFWLGHFMRERGEWQTAKFVYERAIVQHPTDEVIEAARYEIGRCLQAGEQYADALAAYEAILKAYPEGAYQAKAQLGRGQILQRRQQYDAALAALAEAARLDDGRVAAEATLAMGQCFEALGKWQEAADRYLFVTIVFDAPALAGEAYMSAGRCLERLGRADDARKAYAEFVERYPEDANVPAARERLQALQPAPAPAEPASTQ